MALCNLKTWQREGINNNNNFKPRTNPGAKYFILRVPQFKKESQAVEFV